MTLGTHVWVALSGATLSDPTHVIKRAGDATAYTEVGPNAKPSAADDAWVYAGVISSKERDPGDSSPIEIKAPSPGRLRRVKVLRAGSMPKVKFTSKSVTPLAIQLAYRSLVLDEDSTTFVPDQGPTTVEAWVKTQLFAGDDVKVVDVEEFGDLALDGALKADPEKEAEIAYAFLPYANALNAGTL